MGDHWVSLSLFLEWLNWINLLSVSFTVNLTFQRWGLKPSPWSTCRLRSPTSVTYPLSSGKVSIPNLFIPHPSRKRGGASYFESALQACRGVTYNSQLAGSLTLQLQSQPETKCISILHNEPSICLSSAVKSQGSVSPKSLPWLKVR